MKITDVQYKLIQVKPRVRFRIALTSDTRYDLIFVKISTDEGITGYGEACPFAPVTGDVNDDIICFLDKMKTLLIGEDPLCIARIHHIMNRYINGKAGGKAGIDIALYDILGKKANLPLYKLLGGFENTVHSDMTVGIDKPEAMAELAKKYVDEGFRILKIKVGANPEDDVEAVRRIRELVGPGISLRLDANQGWTKKLSVNLMKVMEQFDVDEIEQPLPYWDFDGLRFVKDHISQDMMLDESVLSPADAMHAVKADISDIINIKLMKSGGIYPALQINAICEAAGIPCMVGCMSESRIAIAAGAALTAAQRNIKYADLDGYRMVEEIPGISGGFTQEGGLITLTDKPGLGLDIDF